LSLPATFAQRFKAYWRIEIIFTVDRYTSFDTPWLAMEMGLRGVQGAQKHQTATTAASDCTNYVLLAGE
jgi:hypothetical protein